ncbi:glycosyltransferase family 2 protein [Agrococcus sp. BE272]|uniref:glycosyltransferase family 2 protein n=1 Tax=Agrococcus sp. BE272 TaxID=2817727 RepID=UPI0028671588|nr:glycosyltransferase family 2 protein [Agrococcus sp. BE272]MDR7234325.1 GT2 family glycosyltransferase [Agrococcus sp. BE272]
MGAGSAQALRFAVIVVSFASSDLLRRNAAALELPDDARLVVVDCFSGEAEREQVRALAAQQGWEALLLDANAGFGGGTNAGAARALQLGARVLVALNPDARIDDRSLEALVAAVEADPMLLASPTVLSGDGSPWFAGSDLYLADGVTRGAAARERFQGAPRREWATGACFAMSAALWRRLGGFDEDYFLYWEDIDLSHRALDQGARLALVDAVVEHDWGGTQERERRSRAKSELYYYYNIRNRLLYAVKRLDAQAVQRWSGSAPRVAYGVLKRGGRRQLVTSVRPWRAYLRGLRDGRRLVRAAARTAPRNVERLP